MLRRSKRHKSWRATGNQRGGRLACSCSNRRPLRYPIRVLVYAIVRKRRRWSMMSAMTLIERRSVREPEGEHLLLDLDRTRFSAAKAAAAFLKGANGP